jgi:hypothetical protein
VKADEEEVVVRSHKGKTTRGYCVKVTCNIYFLKCNI